MSDSNIHHQLQTALDSFREPESGRPISKTGLVQDCTISNGVVGCKLALTSMLQPIAQELADSLRDHLLANIEGVKEVHVQLASTYRPAPAIGQIGLRAKSVIAVAAGKGGVGKSTLAASLAIVLENMGAKVGLMDADVYGPSIPHMLGLGGRPEVLDGKIQPIRSGPMPVMSMGFLIEKDQAVVWRGPMLHGSITQFLRDTAWGELDYLIIDMPPGTGDVALTLSQLIPLSGVVIVCTPQEVALLDASKAITMFEKTKVPVLGIVENMSGFTDPESGKTFNIFGKGGARLKAEELGVPFLGEVPIQMLLRSETDEGRLRNALNDASIAKPFEDVARGLVRSVVDQIAKRPTISAPLPVL